MGIGVAAVGTQTREIFFNPGAGLSEEEYKFVMAHELLHVGLRHDVRRSGRDPYVWNIACFPAGTWTGEAVPIEEIAPMRRNLVGALIAIDSQNARVTCTPKHPFYMRKRMGGRYPVKLSEPMWVEAHDVRSGDYLLVPRIRDTLDDTSIDLSAFITDGSDSLGRRTFGNRAVKSIPLDEETAWLIGLYVAEGSASPTVRFSLSAKETEIAERVIGILRRIGYSASVSVVETRLTVSAGTTVFGGWLKAHCGHNAHTKHIPRVILNHVNPKIRRAFLAGLVVGDGHVRKQTASRTTVAMIGSVSERLVCDVALLLAQDGIGGSRGILLRGPRKIGKSTTQRNVVLHIFRWNPDGIARTERIFNGRTLASHSIPWRADEYGVWYPVRSIRSQPFEGEVYNMTTADHTYIANTFLAHNCDYVINAWLIEMRIGVMPKIGALHDRELQGESAESIYDRIVTDMRRFRRLATMRGVGVSDILERNGPEWWTLGEGLPLDDFYRNALGRG
ncbi:MAG TPA: LAGLIDADG family homing endonuclease [Ktedonobacterales bacterium]|nr:LAGLIDADG family homing endonuclease [Ktedonobacterales bacterium]